MEKKEEKQKVIKLGCYKFRNLITIPMLTIKKINKRYRKRNKEGLEMVH